MRLVSDTVGPMASNRRRTMPPQPILRQRAERTGDRQALPRAGEARGERPAPEGRLPAARPRGRLAAAAEPRADRRRGDGPADLRRWSTATSGGSGSSTRTAGSTSPTSLQVDGKRWRFRVNVLAADGAAGAGGPAGEQLIPDFARAAPAADRWRSSASSARG